MTGARMGPLRAAALIGVAGTLAPAQDPAPREVTVRIAQTDGAVRALAGERLLLEYRATGDAWKTYVAQLCTPDGTNVLRVSPADHVHHRGLMFALGADDVDYWGEHYVDRPGIQRGREVSETDARATRSGRVSARLTQDVDWIVDAGAPSHVREHREVGVVGDAGVTLVTWRSVLSPGPGRSTVSLWGRPYFGLGARFLPSMDQTGRFVTPDGQPGELVRGDERVVRGDWCAYAAAIDGAPVTVAMFDHPDNPRHPATWFTMAKPFAYLAATLDLASEPLELTADAALELCYGVAVWDGAVGRERIAETYRQWLDATPSTPTPEERKTP